MAKKKHKYLKYSTGVDMHEKVLNYYKCIENVDDNIGCFKVVSIGFITITITSELIKFSKFKGEPSTKKEFNRALKGVKQQLKKLK
tara:strand:- start:844 stop:1101 length:258 start_codon:yes stop_codon:yes gene_type:complete